MTTVLGDETGGAKTISATVDNMPLERTAFVSDADKTKTLMFSISAAVAKSTP